MAAAVPEQADADFGMDEDLAAQIERMNAEADMAAEGVLPGAKSPGIFARLTKRKPAQPKAPVAPVAPEAPRRRRCQECPNYLRARPSLPRLPPASTLRSKPPRA